MKNLYVIEGTSNSGKTTTSKILQGIPNVEIIEEFMDHPLSPKPSKSIEEELKNQQIFSEIEKERMLLAASLLRDEKIVFMERSYLSILAVSYAFLKLGKYNGYDNALRIYRDMMKQAWYVNPDVTFILTADSNEKLKRNLKRDKILQNNWVKNDFEFYQNEFYDTMSIESRKEFIDTTGKNEEYASECICKKLKLRR